MNISNSNSNKGTIFKVITGIVVPIFCVLLTYFLTNASNQANTVNTLSTYFDVVDENMSYEQALQAIREESKQKDNEIEELQKYKSQVLNAPNLEFKNPALVLEGLKKQDSFNKSLVVIDDSNYYSESILNSILDDRLSYDLSEDTIYYNPNGENISSETKVELTETDVLYDGVCYNVYLPSDGNTFSMGSGTYNDGFVIYDDHSLFGEGDGYALFDLKGQYSKISFDVGRTNEYEKQDVILKVYLDDKYIEEYSLNAQSPPIPLEINLNYANSLKLEISGGSRVKYGFANALLYY